MAGGIGGHMSEESYGLVLSFTGLEFGETTEHAFVYGFEMGQLWERMRSGREAEIIGTFNAVNKTAIERACAADGWEADFTPCRDEVGNDYPAHVFATLRKTKKAQPNPHGLRVAT
jgi:1,4-alpha-glucan branching enzyme